jgi:ubiquinone/menaquinone biosynthesis C-methylase UbiE
MKYSFFQRLKFSIMTKQLRKPSGLLAGKVSNKMNEVNEVVYDFTLENMNIKENEAILEIGFGNGKFFNKLFAKARNVKIWGIDFSKDMVGMATKYNQSSIRAGKLNLQLGSSDNLPFANDSFDKVFCINVIYFWDQPEKHLSEVHRVLKPGGEFFAAIRSKETFSHLPAADYGFTLYNEEEWKTVLEQNNFTLAGVTRKKEDKSKATIDDNLTPHEILCLMAKK